MITTTGFWERKAGPLPVPRCEVCVGSQGRGGGEHFGLNQLEETESRSLGLVSLNLKTVTFCLYVFVC